MNVLVVGGDRIDPIKNILSDLGVAKITHWEMRKSAEVRKQIPQNTECILMLTNFLNHNAMYKVKSSAKKLNVPFVCANRNEHDVFCQFCKFLEKKPEVCPKELFNKPKVK